VFKPGTMRHVEYSARMGEMRISWQFFEKFVEKRSPRVSGVGNTNKPPKYFDGYKTSVCSVGFIFKRPRNLARL